MRLCRFRYALVLGLFVGFQLLISGCGKSPPIANSISSKKTEAEKPADKKGEIDLVGTWVTPPKGQKLIQTEWGPMRTTMTFTKAGKFKTEIRFIEDMEADSILIRTGTYRIEGFKLHLTLCG